MIGENQLALESKVTSILHCRIIYNWTLRFVALAILIFSCKCFAGHISNIYCCLLQLIIHCELISLYSYSLEWYLITFMTEENLLADTGWRQIKEIKKHNILLRSLSLQGVGLKDFVQQAFIFDPSRLSVTSCKNTFPKQMSSPSTFNLTT